MHAAIVHLTPILAAEKSKTPFYIAGGVLVAWALIVSLGLGLRESGFPRTAAAERAVMAVTAVLVAAAASMAVLTSGGSTKEAQAAPGGAQTKLAQAADPSGQLRFAKTSLAAKAGEVSIEFTNRSPLAHNLTIASASTVLGATPTFNGASKTLTLKLKPGTYKFYCSVPGHREAGMEGTLEVRQ